MNKIKLSLFVAILLSLWFAACSPKEKSTETEDVASNETKVEDNYFDFISYLNVGQTPEEIANIMPKNAVKSLLPKLDPSQENFQYVVKDNQIEGFFIFKKWKTEAFVWSFEGSLDVALNMSRGKEIYNEIESSLTSVFGTPSSRDKDYAMWDVIIQEENANISINFVDATVNIDITLVTF
jgi:hypothetical protein